VTGAQADDARAGIARRFLSLSYELLLLAAVVLVGMVPVVLLTESWSLLSKRTFHQLYLVALLGAYFVWQWARGGQTLAMKTWRLKLVTREGATVTPGAALHRYLLALLSVALGGAGFLWAFFDRDRQFLHDRLAGTKIIAVPAAKSSPPPR
jgi:uncharacterized RDD family membrane protein YckC